MARMKAGKDHALATVWLQLLGHVEVQNVKVKMRDGWEEEMRIYTPTPKSQDASSGEEGKKDKRGMPVVYSLHGGGFIAGS
jgi:acetyl esterase/lipase